MKTLYTLFYLALFMYSCKTSVPGENQSDNVVVGNHFLDAFYSFNRDSLQILLSSAETSQPEILYYQAWAECAHYTVIDRTHHFEKNDSTIILPVTVKDDLMSSLGINFNV